MTDQAAMNEKAGKRTKQFVCFKLANEEYAIDIRCIQEVVKPSKITRIPQMPPFLLGVINNRGNIIPVFDLRKKIHLADQAFNSDTRFLVATVEHVTISLVVDRVLDNVKFDMDKVDPAPQVKMSMDHDHIHGLGDLDGRMIVILDLEKIHASVMKDISSH